MSINHIKEKNFSRSISSIAVFFCIIALPILHWARPSLIPGTGSS